MIPAPTYTQEEHGTWALLYEKQKELLPGRACKEYLEGIAQIQFPEDHIPKLQYVSDALKKATGWELERVEGLVPENEFFQFLAQKKFPSTDFIRKREELQYTPAPDMFHDLFGHTPMITNPRFASFFETFGKAALNADEEETKRLQRFYWFTVEFGLIKNKQGKPETYGSGILSSPGEVVYCLEKDVERHEFDVKTVTNQEFDIWHMQGKLFVIESFEQLEETFRDYAKSKNLI